MTGQQRGQQSPRGAVKPPILPAVPATPPPPSGIPSTPPWPPGSRAPQTPAEAAQLIADALNAAAQAGFSPRWDGEEGTVTCSRYVGSRWEHGQISEDHEGVWGPRG